MGNSGGVSATRKVEQRENGSRYPLKGEGRRGRNSSKWQPEGGRGEEVSCQLIRIDSNCLLAGGRESRGTSQEEEKRLRENAIFARLEGDKEP